MIPKRAFFYWEGVNGAEMTWIRKECIESFKRHNPSWEVVFLDGDKSVVPGDAYIDVVHRSDVARYMALRDRGGLYLDTDVVFLKPIPEDWCECDLLLPKTVDNQFPQVAALGSIQGSKFFGAVARECEKIIANRRHISYQGLGVEVMSRCVNYAIGADVRWLRAEAILPVPWRKAEMVWNPSLLEELPSGTVGVHWFGGDVLSKHMEGIVDEEWARTSDALLAQWVRKSREVVARA